VVVDGTRREEPPFAAFIQLVEKAGVEIFFAGRKDIAYIKTTETFPGVLAVVAMKDTSFQAVRGSGPFVCLDGVNDPGNLGTIIRTADWFGVSTILLGQGSVDMYNEKVVRSTMGSFFRTTICKVSNLADSLEKFISEGYSVYAFTMEGLPAADLRVKRTDKVIFLFGSESHGISSELQRLCTASYTIERKGQAESLNVGVAVGIALSHITD